MQKPEKPDLKFLHDLAPELRNTIMSFTPKTVKAGTVLFRSGDIPTGYLIVLNGRIEVHLVGKSGRELLLYEVGKGETCIQTTLCLLGDKAYAGEAFAATDTSVVVIPKARFEELMDGSRAFRSTVFRAFGDRLQDVVAVLEKVAFVRLDTRLASEIVRRTGKQDNATVTHQELATAIGSTREVVSRRLEALQNIGLLRLDRGSITILNRGAMMDAAKGE